MSSAIQDNKPADTVSPPVGAAEWPADPADRSASSALGRPMRPRFRHVSPLTGETTKRLLDHAGRVTMTLGGQNFSLGVRFGGAMSRDADVFEVSAGEHLFQIEIEQIHELLDVPRPWWDVLPGGLKCDLLLDLVVVSFPDLRVTVKHLCSLERAESVSLPCAVALELIRDGADRGYRVVVRFQSSAAADLLIAGWGGLEGTGPGPAPDVLLPVRVELMSAWMPGSELARLRAGALVPVGAPLEGKEILVSVGWGDRLVAPGVVSQKIVTLRGGLKPMTEAKAGGVGIPMSDLSKMEDLEVQFTVELATCSLRLSELARLGPGSTLNLGLPHEPALVRLCVNGKAVATGELVVLGQSLGVQVVDMAADRG